MKTSRTWPELTPLKSAALCRGSRSESCVKSGKAIEQMVGSLAGKVAGVQHNEGVAALIDAAFSNAARYRTAIFE